MATIVSSAPCVRTELMPQRNTQEATVEPSGSVAPNWPADGASVDPRGPRLVRRRADAIDGASVDTRGPRLVRRHADPLDGASVDTRGPRLERRAAVPSWPADGASRILAAPRSCAGMQIPSTLWYRQSRTPGCAARAWRSESGHCLRCAGDLPEIRIEVLTFLCACSICRTYVLYLTGVYGLRGAALSQPL
jgi:hypothetical protein